MIRPSRFNTIQQPYLRRRSGSIGYVLRMGHHYRFKRRDVVTIISGRGIYVIWEIPIKTMGMEPGPSGW